MPAKVAAPNGDADDRAHGAGGYGPGQMRGHARRADKDLRAFGLIAAHQLHRAVRSAVGRTDGDGAAYAQPAQHVHTGGDFFFIRL